MTGTTIRVSTEHGLARIVLAHPPLNILTRAMLAEISDALASLAGDHALRALLLSADGKHFSAGADVAEHLPPSHEDLIPAFLDTIAALTDFPVPTVAAVHGKCLGGGFELVLAADITVAAEGAVFGQPEILLGVTAPAACALLPTRAGPALAAQILFTGDPVPATDALAAGFVRQLVPAEELLQAADALLARITRHSATALRATKRSMRAAAAVAERAALSTAREVYLRDLMTGSDAVEGLTAFLEKRPPTWSHT